MAKNKKQKINLTITVVIVSIFIWGLFQFSSDDNVAPVNTLEGSVLSVHFIDVGQGDSILIKSKDSAVLIDAGDNDKASIVTNYLKQQDVKKINLLVGTHPHADHIGGLDAVINDFEIEKILMPKISGNLVPTTKTYKDVLESISKKGLKISQPTTGETFSFGNFSLEVLSEVAEYANLNDYSIVLKLTCGDFSALFAGDAESVVEEKLLQKNIKANVFKASHHGSKTSNSVEFLKKVAPSDVVICVGIGNKYFHPHSEILDRFKAQSINVYRTDLKGSIVVQTNAKTFEISSSNDVKQSKDDFFQQLLEKVSSLF
jgi:competence protein ComEC